MQHLSDADQFESFAFESNVKAVVTYGSKSYKARQPIPIDHPNDRIGLRLTMEQASKDAVISFFFQGDNPRQTLNASLTLAVRQAPFQLVAPLAGAQPIYLSQSVPIALAIGDSAAGLLKHFRFQSAMGGTLICDGVSYQAGDTIPISGARALSALRFTPAKVGEGLDLYFMADGFAFQPLRVPFTAQEPPFLIAASPAGVRSTYVGQHTPIGLQVKARSVGLPKSFWFQSAMGGTLTYDGNSYKAGDRIAISPETSLESLVFTPDSPGENLDLYFMTDGLRPQKFTIPLVAKPLPFQVAVSPAGTRSIYVGQSPSIQLQIGGAFAGLLKRFWFQSAMGGTLSYGGNSYKAGDRIAISAGTSLLDLVYKPDSAGKNLDLYFMADGFKPRKFTVPLRAKYPPIKVDICSMDSILPIIKSQYVWPFSKIGFCISTGTAFSAPTRLSFQVDQGDSLMSYNYRKTYPAGAIIPIDKGSHRMVFRYKPSTTGKKTLNFTFMDDYGQTQDVKATVEVNPVPITSIRPTKPRRCGPGICFDISFNFGRFDLTQLPHEFHWSYTMKTKTGELSAKDYDMQYAPDTPYEFIAGPRSLSFYYQNVKAVDEQLSFTVKGPYSHENHIRVSIPASMQQ